MSDYGVLRRYYLLLQKMNRRDYPSISDLENFLSRHDIHVSERTIKRDFTSLRTDFALDVQYDSLHRGYYIDEDMSVDLEPIMSFLDFTVTADLLVETFKQAKSSIKYVSFSHNNSLKGRENLKPIFEAVANKRVIHFEYFNYSKEESYRIELYPGLIREYEYRWYIIGYVQPSDEHRTFAIDRISDLRVSSETFADRRSDQLRALFDAIIGLNYSEHSVTEVVLSVDPLQAKYITSLPLHHSQQVISQTDDELILKLKIQPNFEFEQRLLMLSDQLEVLKPDWLRDNIRQRIKIASEKYNTT